MTILFDVDIIAAVERGDISITDFDASEEGPLGPNSYDLNLGSWFYEVVWGVDGPWYVGPRYLEEGGIVYIPNGATFLGMTKQRVGTRGQILGMMKSISSFGREGGAVCKCSGLGDVGYDNWWTLEISITNQGAPGFVTVGQRICQMVFFEGKREPRSPYNGQYRLEQWPLCMVPKAARNRIVSDKREIPMTQAATETVYAEGGKISLR